MFVSLLFALSAGEASDHPAGRTSAAIGIDLGTTYSCVAVYQNSRVEIVASRTGSRVTPSIVAFKDGRPLVGEAARTHLTTHPETTVDSIKRLIGLPYSDPILQNELPRLSYKVSPDSKDHPFVQIPVNNTIKKFSPEAISALILREMKSIAERFLGFNVTEAVVTVPAYFNDGQRKATIDAGTIAGLKVLQILSEPTAACIAYGFDKNTAKRQKLLVFDLGGGTFDVSVVIVHNGTYEVLAVNGDAHLGGIDFDQRIVEYLKELFRSTTGKDISGDRKALAKLTQEAIKAKITLSTSSTAEIEIDGVDKDHDFKTELTRAKFEELCKDLFQRTQIPLANVLQDAHLRTDEIDEVVLVGGSTRIPKIQKLVRDFFDGKEPAKNINPDEAVAYGAALQAASLEGTEGLNPVVLYDVTPLSIGTELSSGALSKIILRNTRIPTTQSNMFTTSYDNQARLDISIYEGENNTANANHKLGQFELVGIPPAKQGVPQIEITCHLDVNGVLSVTAEDKGSKVKSELAIQWNEVRLSGDALEEAIKAAILMEEEAARIAAGAAEKSRFETWLRNLPEKIKEAVSAELAAVGDQKLTVEAINAKKSKIRERLIAIINTETKGKAENNSEL